ncbi:4-hydroxy-tetrahydrodipicolinate synthase [Arsenicicoccus sp. oral taxon 190]|uniref:4-hydroxy-tetrahydrodipicolinate synthase n=1 Tax=Arsenicicoccus sp. oral taxon 190 TaxID=1658671 RepID=UPI00067A149B|nr:4-hydroxy-tetrahydrodipicolinate synthase [Arsenicicoccus sp. oral taxon 190]AKT52209.1 dihydrodipicolinate synthase [Arsenicicoccus sp. oral taxon 190]
MTSAPAFGRVLSAVVTPMLPDGSLDRDGVQRVARHLVDHGHDGIVVNGTTGESPTTSDAEKVELLRLTREAVGDGVVLVAGVGTNDTRHTVELARQAADAGADGLLVVTPYYNKPPVAGLEAHFRTVADATDLPVMLYDIPGRAGVPIPTELLLRLADHPRIVAVKDAKGDLWAATKVLSRTDLQWYSGDDVANFAHLALGAVGIVSVVGHVAGVEYSQMVGAMAAGDVERAREIHRRLVPVVDAVMNVTQGAIMTKAALVELGVLAHRSVRLPLVEATPDQVEIVRSGLRDSGLL